MTYARRYYCGYCCNDVDHQMDGDHRFTYPTPEDIVNASNWAELRHTGENFRHAIAHQEPHPRNPCNESLSLEMVDKLPRRVGSHFRGAQAFCENRNRNVAIEFDDVRSWIIPQIIALVADQL